MKTKSLFIVRTPDNKSLFNEKVRVIAENTLLKDLGITYASKYPEEKCKYKLIQGIAREQLVQLNGQSITEQEYQDILTKCVDTIHEYEHISLLRFSEMLTIYQQVENARREQAIVPGVD